MEPGEVSAAFAEIIFREIFETKPEKKSEGIPEKGRMYS